MPVGGVLEDRERRLDLRQRKRTNAFGRSGVDSDTRGTEAVVQKNLHERSAGGMTDQDGRGLQPADDPLQKLDDRGHRQRLDRRRILVERFHLDLEAGIRRGEHLETAAAIVIDPFLPASWRHPEAVDENDGVRGGRVSAHESAFRSHGLSAPRESGASRPPLNRSCVTPETSPKVVGICTFCTYRQCRPVVYTQP
jgi:hypothetical protein